MSIVLLMLFLLFLLWQRIMEDHREEKEKKAEPEKKRPVSVTEPVREVYSTLTMQVTELVKRDFPEASWIWESPDAMQEIMLGGKVYILLNRAGGYRRAEVIYRNLDVADLDYRMEKEAFRNGPPEPEPEEPLEDNYELLAFQWTEAHITELGERCSEAVLQGKNELLIPFDELPDPESWQDICRELMRNKLSKVKVVTDGILILL